MRPEHKVRRCLAYHIHDAYWAKDHWNRIWIDGSVCRGANRTTGKGSEQGPGIHTNWWVMRHDDRPRAQWINAGFQSKQLILQAKLNLGDVDQYLTIDVTIDGADE